MNSHKKWRAIFWWLGALIAGVAFGSIVRSGPVIAVLTVAGNLWMNALRMIALPLALFNTICAMAGERASLAFGRIGGAFALYFTLLAGSAGMVLVFLPPMLRSTPIDHDAISAVSRTPNPQAAPENRTISLGDFLPLLVFATVFGLALRHTRPETGGAVIQFARGASETLMVMVRWVIACAPPAMFALAATFAAKSGTRVIGILGRFIFYECLFLIAFCALFYPLATLAGGVSLGGFVRAAAGPQMVAITTRSSMAALPALLDAGEKLLTETPQTVRVILPISVGMFKLNRTISALCRLLVILYFWSVPLQAGHLAVFVLTVMLLSLSELGIPGGSTYRTVPAYLAAGCPIEAVMLLEVLEPISDICKTLVNVTGDLAIAAVVVRWRGREAREPVFAGVGSTTS